MAKLDHLVERQEQGSQRWVPPEECRGTKHQIEEAVKEAQALHQARAVGQAAHKPVLGQASPRDWGGV